MYVHTKRKQIMISLFEIFSIFKFINILIVPQWSIMAVVIAAENSALPSHDFFF